MTEKKIVVYSPASIANVGPGFDSFGIALKGIGDTVTISTTTEDSIYLDVKGRGAKEIPRQPEKNSSGTVAKYVKEKFNEARGFNIFIEKGIEPGKGLGSSGASAAATAYGINVLLDMKLNRAQLIQAAAMGEASVSGSPHADNVTASLLGGFTVVNSEYNAIKLPPPKVKMALVTPVIELGSEKTRRTRGVLPKTVEFKTAMKQMSYASLLVASVATGDAKMFGKCIRDVIVEPSRAKLIPGFNKVKKAALDAGAYGCSIAGGGPSLFAIGGDAYKISKAMSEAFVSLGVKCEPRVIEPTPEGSKIISKNFPISKKEETQKVRPLS